MNFEREFYKIESRARRVRAKAEQLGNEPGIVVLVLGGERQLGALISPSTDTPGHWQLTWFDVDGWSGHTTRKTKAEAAQTALQEGYVDRDRDLLRRLSHTKRFREGNAKLEAIRLINEGGHVPAHATDLLSV